MNKFYINEGQVLSTIEKVLRENRKVLKLGNSAPAAPAPMPQEPMPQDMGMAPQGNGMDMGMTPDMGEGPNAMGNDMPMGDEGNQFDNNFDAGVEADEETDPKRYIQQLTGKLSQSLNSFNGEQGGDTGLSKYVASMIVTAACKSLDDKAKKEIIEKINSTSSDNEDEVPEDSGMGDEGMEDGDMSDMQNVPNEQMPMNEKVYTKKQIFEMLHNLENNEERPLNNNKNLKREVPKAWRSKF